MGCDPGGGVTATALVGHPDCSLHDTGWKHPDHQGRLPAVVRAIERDMPALHRHLREIEARPATEAELLRVHTPEHLDRVRAAVQQAASLGASVSLDADTRVSGASWAAALAAAGTVLSATEAVRSGAARNAFCLARPPGRGASATQPGRFSLFNNVAVGVRHLQEEHGVRCVLVVDWGADPPLGTQDIFQADPCVHLLRGAFGAAELEAAVAATRPEWIFLAAEFGDDPEPVYARTRLLRECAEAACQGRLVSVLEGGYAAAALGKAVVQHLRALAALPPA